MAEAILMGSVHFPAGQAVKLPAGAGYAGQGAFRRQAVHKYYHADSGKWFLLAPENGGWRLYEFGPGDCPCTAGFKRVT